MTKEVALDKIAEEITHCEICQTGTHGKPVPGEGNANADIVFLGEAPGRTEALTGRPFIGRSGKLLRSLIRTVGLSEEEVYITSPVKYLPDRGTPTKKQIEHGSLHLEKQLSVIEPKIIVLLGSVAAQAVLGKKIPIVQMHGKKIKKDGSPRGEAGRTYLVTVHPAAVVRFQKYKAIMLDDFEKLKKMI